MLNLDVFFWETLLDPMNDLDREKQFVDLHSFWWIQFVQKGGGGLKVVYPMLSLIVGA